MTTRRQRLETWLGGAICFFFAAFILAYCVVEYAHGVHTFRWVQVNGKILHSSVIDNNNSDNTTYTAVVEYQYKYQGLPFRGSRIQFGEGFNTFKGHEKKLSAMFAEGADVPVFVDAANPSESVLIRGTSPVMLLPDFVGGCFLLAAIYAVIQSLSRSAR